MKQFIALIIGIVVLCFVLMFVATAFINGTYSTGDWKAEGRAGFVILSIIVSIMGICMPVAFGGEIINYFEKGEKK